MLLETGGLLVAIIIIHQTVKVHC